MKKRPSSSRFPRDIALSAAPLVEAWLEIQWKLEPVEPPQFMKDPGFLFALGPFYESIKEEYPIREELPAANMPENALPHIVRYRFFNEDRSALMQIGPGVASINVLRQYTRQSFFDKALVLRKRLLDAYQGSNLETQAIILRYRNVEPVDYYSTNVLDFMRDYLNTSITIPPNIPGRISKGIPSSSDLNLSFPLDAPKGTGNLRMVTGERKTQHTDDNADGRVLIWELSVASRDENVPPLEAEERFQSWLHDAHDIIHEWFFALIEGKLFDKYR